MVQGVVALGSLQVLYTSGSYTVLTHIMWYILIQKKTVFKLGGGGGAYNECICLTLLLLYFAIDFMLLLSSKMFSKLTAC